MNANRLLTSSVVLSVPLVSVRASVLAYTLVSVLALGACSMKPMAPATTGMTVQLSGANEVPPVMSAATGTLVVALNPSTNVLNWTVSYSGLSGPVTGAHFHGPAMAGQNAGVVVPLTGSMSSPITGTATLTPAQAADLAAGKWYVNLHTAANPGGEIRGQVPMRP